jgi:GTP pyrophosphokinase
MVLNTIKYLIAGADSSAKKGYNDILQNLSLHDDNPEHKNNIKMINNAFDFGYTAHKGQLRKSGEEYFSHCISVGLQLSQWNMDCDVVIAGILHDTLEDTSITKKEIKDYFNEDIANLVEGVSKLSDIKFNSREQKQAENFMKMFLSVAKDIRVIIIKFADRLHNLRTINYLSLIKQRRVAKESKDIFVPLAHRLGMNNVKLEMEDIIFQILEPKMHKEIKKKIKDSKKKREHYINKFIHPVKEELKKYKLEAKVFGRAKNFSSIYYKMQSRTKEFDEIFDLFAIRIIVEEKDLCYAALGTVHQLYTPVQDRFKDYIATPKRNGYQSIHTTVIGKSGKMVEVQIRTERMDRTAEIGIAAHWTYKEDGSIVSDKENDINRHVKWLRELIENLQSENKNPKEFFKLLKIDLFQDEIFVFTPSGDLIQLKTESTPIDFAFEVHTQVGMHCIGAKVNSNIVPLNATLKSGDNVEILTSKKQTPSHAWLKFVKTAKAKAHIKRWVNKDNNEKSIKLGKELLEKTLRRVKQIHLLNDIEKNPKLMGLNSLDLIYAEIAAGHITTRELISKYAPNLEETKEKRESTLTEKFIERARGQTKGIKVGGIANTLINFGKCCNPIPGDEVVGYITRGKGVTVHRSTCSNIPVLENEDRFVDVDWDIKSDSAYLVRLNITASDRKHLLKDISEKVSLLNIYIQSIDMKAHDGFATCILIIQVRDTRQLERLFRKLKQLTNIISINRR